MNSKSFGLFAVGILALVMVLGFASAAIVLTPDTASVTTSQAGSSSFTFTIQNTDTNSTYSGFTAVSSSFTSGTNTLSASNIAVGTLPTTLSAGATSSGVLITVNVPTSQATGTYTGTITVDANGTPTNPISKTIDLTITVTQGLSQASICAFTGGASVISSSELKVDIRDVTVTDGFGENEEWLLFDEVEVEVKIENNGNFDLDDITVEWGIANDALTDFAVDFDEVDEINLKDGDEDTVVVKFQVSDEDLDNMDLDELSGLDYNLVFRAVGTIDDPDQGTFDNQNTCAADFQEISIQGESDFVILTDLEVPQTVSCSETVEIRANVWNIGDSQQDEVKVEVYDRNKKIVDEAFQVGDVDEFDNTDLSFSFDIPNSVTEGNHNLILRVLDEDGDVYENDFNEDPSEYSVPLSVSGCVPEVTVSASTVSGGQAGRELVVKSTITNTGSSQSVYTLSISGANAWTSSASLDQTSLVLAPGESRDVTVTFNVNKGAEGSQTFSIDLASSGGQTTSQPVVVSIKPASGFFGITGNSVSGSPMAWGLGLLVLVLIVAIIVVAVRKK